MQTVALVIALLSPFLLKFAPRSWQGAPMAAGAIIAALLLGIGALALDGKLPHSWSDASSVSAFLVALVGAQQAVYALLKDALNLSAPSAAPQAASGTGQP
jgi:hypothetical protein